MRVQAEIDRREAEKAARRAKMAPKMKNWEMIDDIDESGDMFQSLEMARERKGRALSDEAR